ncbi:hypothetical protein [Stenotrophomonas beteli]|nr:hypothetical protein [Stenotrophomonas maltophilia]
MRILTDQELDEVFGGDSSVGLTLNRVTVHGPTFSTFNVGGYFSYGPGYSESSGGQSGGSSGSGYGVVHHAVDPSTLPRADKMECKVAAVAEPGHADTANVRVVIVNAHANKQIGQETYEFRSDSPEVPDGYQRIRGALYVDPNSYQPDGSYTRANAMLFVDAFKATPDGTRSHRYYNDAGELQEQGRPLGALTAEENAIFVAAHEYQHAYQARYPQLFVGLDKEADAETYGLKALDRYRAGTKGNCD